MNKGELSKTLKMWGFAQTFALYFLCSGTQSLAEPRESICGGARTERIFANEPGMILFDNSSDNRHKLGYLLIDDSGVPLVYHSPRMNQQTGITNDLFNLNPRAVESLWHLTTPTSSKYRAVFVEWHEARWCEYQVELLFDDYVCTQFRASGPGISMENWQPSGKLQSSFASPSSTAVTRHWFWMQRFWGT